MTDTQAPIHSPSNIAARNTCYRYMRRAKIIPKRVVQIYSGRIRTCIVTGGVSLREWERDRWEKVRNIGKKRSTGCKLFNTFIEVINVGNW